MAAQVCMRSGYGRDEVRGDCAEEVEERCARRAAGARLVASDPVSVLENAWRTRTKRAGSYHADIDGSFECSPYRSGPSRHFPLFSVVTSSGIFSTHKTH
eukprot:342523-Rhodomonas_salina.2